MLKGLFQQKKSSSIGNEIAVRICFNILQGLGEFVNYLIEKNSFGFTPEIMYIDYEERDYEKNKALEIVKNADNNKGIIFKLKDESISLTINYQAVMESPLVMSWNIKNQVELNEKLKSTIETLAHNTNFIVCYVYNYWDEYWQSATFESDYEIYGQPHKHLKRTENLWGEEVIDTSKNYGKIEVLRNINIMAAPIMYFGQWYYDNICSYDKLKANYEYEELPNKILKIKLSSSVFEINRNEQEKFLNFIEIEKVREKFSVFSERKFKL